MDSQTIQRQYDDVIAAHYDLDPQSVNDRALDGAIHQIRKHHLFEEGGGSLKVLDVGVGTGKLLARLKELGGHRVSPFGLDFSEKMVETACRKVPDLVAEVDDAANLAAHFTAESFDVICTHFITGYVPMATLAPQIHRRLAKGGHWSFVGGTQAGFPALRATANRRLVRLAFGRGRKLAPEPMTCNPNDRAEVVKTLEANGFAVRAAETFEPGLLFSNFEEFMSFGYRGGWLTPFIETLGLHKAGPITRMLLDTMVFPIEDHHSIEIVLAQKVND